MLPWFPVLAFPDLSLVDLYKSLVGVVNKGFFLIVIFLDEAGWALSSVLPVEEMMHLPLQALRCLLQKPPKRLWLKRPGLRTRSVLEKGGGVRK